MTSLQQRWESAFLPTYATPSVELVRGEGAWVHDAEGRKYLDLLAGIAVSSLGHAHPAVVEAVTHQVATLAHTSNLYANGPSLQLAERLQALLPVPAKVFLCNDGASANEAAFKVARKNLDDHGTKRTKVVAAEGSFHGRTAAALAVTGQSAKREPFLPLPGEVCFVPFNDRQALAAAVDDSTAAVFLEPIQGEGGVYPADPGYLSLARQLCDDTGALLIVDEVQTGIGRTGQWLACIDEAVVPDIVTLAKGLGGGLPIGAVIATGKAMDLLVPGDHGSTFGGNLVSCAAANAVLEVIESTDLLAAVRELGAYLTQQVAALENESIAGMRGRGLLQAVVFSSPIAKGVEASARRHGFLVNAVTADAIRLAPPLIISKAEIDTFVDALPLVIEESLS